MRKVKLEVKSKCIPSETKLCRIPIHSVLVEELTYGLTQHTCTARERVIEWFESDLLKNHLFSFPVKSLLSNSKSSLDFGFRFFTHKHVP